MRTRNLLSMEQINNIQEIMEAVSFEIAVRDYINGEFNSARFKQNMYPFLFFLLIPIVSAPLTSQFPIEIIAGYYLVLFMIYYAHHHDFIHAPIDYLSEGNRERVSCLLSELQELNILNNVNKDTSIKSFLTELKKIVPEAKDHRLFQVVCGMGDVLLNRFREEYKKAVAYRELGFFQNYRDAVEAGAIPVGKNRQRARSIAMSHM